MAGQLGVSPDEIAIVRNTSESNNTINNGVPLSAGDEVVICGIRTTRPTTWRGTCGLRGSGITVKRVSVPRQPGLGPGADRPLRRGADRPDARAVRSPTSRTSAGDPAARPRTRRGRAHARGIHVHLDGAQSWGALDVRPAVSSAAIPTPRPPTSGSWARRRPACSTSGRIAHPRDLAQHRRAWLGQRRRPRRRRARASFESLGQRDDACLAAVGTTADFHDAIGGPGDRGARSSELATVLKQGLAELGMTLVTPMDPALSGGVCIIEAAWRPQRTALRRLYEEHGIAGAGTGGLRLCPHVYNTREHIDRADRWREGAAGCDSGVVCATAPEPNTKHSCSVIAGCSEPTILNKNV